MRILAHRGVWERKESQNSLASFRDAFQNGWGIETDIRDQDGRLVISHDMPTGSLPSIQDLLELAGQYSGVPLALNIKADGLQGKLADALGQRAELDYYVFDMAVPDMLIYAKRQLRYYTRQSEIEKMPVLYEDASGVWMDMFFSDWITQGDVETHLTNGKQVCLVSSELHKRDCQAFWETVRQWPFVSSPQLQLCTDFPARAKEYFAI